MSAKYPNCDIFVVCKTFNSPIGGGFKSFE